MSETTFSKDAQDDLQEAFESKEIQDIMKEPSIPELKKKCSCGVMLLKSEKPEHLKSDGHKAFLLKRKLARKVSKVPKLETVEEKKSCNSCDKCGRPY